MEVSEYVELEAMDVDEIMCEIKKDENYQQLTIAFNKGTLPGVHPAKQWARS